MMSELLEVNAEVVCMVHDSFSCIRIVECVL